MTLQEYVKKRNGVSMSSSNSLRNNLYRSLGAKNFALFWNYWNPIFGYYLGIKIYKPLKKVVPASISLVTTFVFCGMIHDLVTTIVRGKLSIFFSIWFLIMALFVLISKFVKQDFSAKKWIFRAASNILILCFSFFATDYIYQLLKIKFPILEK